MRKTSKRPPVSNLSGHNGPDGPCDHLVKCECIGVIRDEAGKPIGLLFESPDAGPAAGPSGAPSGSPPIEFLFSEVGDCDKCAPGPTQTIDPDNPPDGITFADPDNPTHDELAAAAAALLDGATPGTKAKFGDEPCQWVYEAGPNGEVCLIERPFIPQNARLRVANLGGVLGNLTVDTPTGAPIGYGSDRLKFEVICKQDLHISGYYHLRYYGPQNPSTIAQGRAYVILDGTPFRTGEIWVVTGEANGTEFAIPFDHVFECVTPGIHTLDFDLEVSGFAGAPGQIHPNQVSIAVTNLLGL